MRLGGNPNFSQVTYYPNYTIPILPQFLYYPDSTLPQILYYPNSILPQLLYYPDSILPEFCITEFYATDRVLQFLPGSTIRILEFKKKSGIPPIHIV